MPIYDYGCKKCGSVSEYFLPIKSTKKIKCRNCKSVRTFKIYGSYNFILKGDGWPGKEIKKKK